MLGSNGSQSAPVLLHRERQSDILGAAMRYSRKVQCYPPRPWRSNISTWQARRKIPSQHDHHSHL
jgi:hypothetical protein